MPFVQSTDACLEDRIGADGLSRPAFEAGMRRVEASVGRLNERHGASPAPCLRNAMPPWKRHSPLVPAAVDHAGAAWHSAASGESPGSTMETTGRMDRRTLTGIAAVAAVVLVGAIGTAIWGRQAPPADLPREVVRPPTAQAPAADPLPQVQSPSAPDPRRTARHGDWQLRCDQIPGQANEQCSIVQTVVAQDQDNLRLVVIALVTREAEPRRILRIVAPLGVLLTQGLGLRIDEADIGATDFVRCVPNGCIAESVIGDALFQRLRAGRTATFIVFQTPEVGNGIPVSLAGFAEGFDALR
jgi:invasion protein IalB